MNWVIWFNKIWFFNRIGNWANVPYLGNHGMSSLIIKHLWKFWHSFQHLKYGILPSINTNHYRFKSFGKVLWEKGLDSWRWDLSTNFFFGFQIWILAFLDLLKVFETFWLLLLMVFTMCFYNFQLYSRLPRFEVFTLELHFIYFFYTLFLCCFQSSS